MKAIRKIRVLIAKVGLDAHDRGAKVLSMVLKNAGMEVIYMGLRNTPEMVAQTALQENADVLGISSLAGSHLEVARMVSDELKKRGFRDVLFLMGGIIPKKDFEPLHEMGARGIFSVHASFDEIVAFVRDNVHRSAV